MKTYDCTQGSPEWHALHFGRPSASGFDRLITPKARKRSAQAERYAIELCASFFLGEPLEGFSTAWMARGLELEDDARRWYEFTHDVKVARVGFITDDGGRYGCSPDGLVGAEGLLEIKCLSAANHVAALLGEAEPYTLQVQGQLWICERTWCDRLYYNPALPPVVQRVERDEELIAQLAETVEAFCDKLHVMQTRLMVLGCRPKETDI